MASQNFPVRIAVELDAGEMSCLEWSNAQGPALIFSHANGFNAQTYSKLLEPLARSLYIIACDLRGHGFSTLPTAEGMAKNWTVFCDDLIATMDTISPQPAVLAGHSLGAMTSLMAAARLRERVRAVLLVEPVLIPPLRQGDEAGAGELARRAERRRNVFPSHEAAFEAYRGRGIFVFWPDDVVADYLRGGLIEQEDGTVRLACAPAWEADVFRGAPHDLASLAAEVTCPITIMVGTKASSTSHQQLDIIRTLRPDTRIVSVPGATHFLPMEHPEAVREEFLRAVQ